MFKNIRVVYKTETGLLGQMDIGTCWFNIDISEIDFPSGLLELAKRYADQDGITILGFDIEDNDGIMFPAGQYLLVLALCVGDVVVGYTTKPVNFMNGIAGKVAQQKLEDILSQLRFNSEFHDIPRVELLNIERWQ